MKRVRVALTMPLYAAGAVLGAVGYLLVAASMVATSASPGYAFGGWWWMFVVRPWRALRLDAREVVRGSRW